MGSRIILFNEVILVSVLALICILISVGSPKFLSSTNVLNILRDSSMDVIAAIGMTMLLITGEVDLSIGSLVAFVGVVTMDVTNTTHNVALGVAAGLGLGLLTGLVNGLVRTKLKVNSLIGTIAMMMVLRGGVYIYHVAAVQNYHSLDAFFQIGNGYVGFLPIPILIMVVLYLVFLFVVTRTRDRAPPVRQRRKRHRGPHLRHRRRPAEDRDLHDRLARLPPWRASSWCPA